MGHKALVLVSPCWGKVLSAAVLQKSWPVEGRHLETLSPVLQRLAVLVQPGSIPKGRSVLARVRGGRSFLRANGEVEKGSTAARPCCPNRVLVFLRWAAEFQHGRSLPAPPPRGRGRKYDRHMELVV